MTIKGSCLCGGIRYEVRGPLTGALYCHCTMCQKAQGSAFRARAGVAVKDFHLLEGEALLTFYASSPGTYRVFCKVCGSPVLSRFDDYPDVYGLPLGLLDDDPELRPQMHVHTASKAAWHTIADDLPQFPGAAP
ncbi:GFA family protein [Pigmentiphaga aceris]|uniref:GFA family protein n=1 Tax=Pigmentiphaga aceris TaxID=1940612 RepID=A0A5C0B1Z7_9BURK|nr:GFA family protein [Pigmentiphaga aceris]QEI08758.1 GFA family protein [Pigmentiphaga aceris]